MRHRNFNELKHKGTSETLAAARTALNDALTLGELRRARSLTQHQLAAALETSQGGVSRIEQRTDLYLSTLRSYVEALGGELELRAVFPDGAVPIASFEALEERELETA